MSILDVIRNRRSVRTYKNDPIPEDILHKVLEAGRLAPSGKNLQPWKFIIIKDSSLKNRVAEACAKQFFMAAAPVIIAACAFPENCYAHMGRYMKSWPIDVAIALEHMILMAQEAGLGTCWIGAFDENQVKPLLNIPESVRVLALTPLGYPDESPRDRGRKPLEEIVSYDHF